MTHQKTPQGIRKALLQTVALVGMTAVLAPGLALAQEAAEEDVDEVIIVTGTRIARDPNVASPTPIQTINEEAITQSGVFNTADVLNDVPALMFSSTSETSNQDATRPDGQNTLDLRGLGEDRTLTLVNGRRFVSGVEGAQSVDIGSIPQALIERVDVLTGGASAIYGADAVTGVVNFVLRDDFEGLDLNVRGGISSEGDGEQYSGSALWGRNFANGRGNVTLSLGYENNPGLLMGDRDWAANNQVSDDDSNPALRFQQGEITPGGTPALANWYDLSNGYFPWGLRIPDRAAFETEYQAAFGVPANLNAAEIALFDRAADAPSRAILPNHAFSVSSRNGVISSGDFLFNGVDVNSNGQDDCTESFVGFNSTFEGGPDVFGLGPFGFNSFGALGGCWVAQNGGVRPYRDGLVAGNFNQFGGDGIENFFSQDIIVPKEQRVTMSLNGHIDLNDGVTAFGELLYSYHHVDTGGPLNTFYDLLYGAPDNPYLPAELQTLANNTGGLFITRDPTDLGPNVNTNERRTFRTVFGLRGDWENGWNWELAANVGEFTLRQTDRNDVILDRFFAAIDVVDADPGAGVTPVCRSDVDPFTPPPATVFDIPVWDTGFFTFTPGDGQCRPANIWAGDGAISQEAIGFITETSISHSRINQFVLSAQVGGELPFGLPAGHIGFAGGLEYRKETSQFRPPTGDQGFLPEGSPFPAGTNIHDVSNNFGTHFAGGESLFVPSHGDYDLSEVFAEISVPVLRDAPFAHELTIDAAARYSEYSTIGNATTWKTNAVWAPIQSLRFRTSVSQSVRAPNIFELFSPDQPGFFRPIDPCDVTELGNAPDPAVRTANCATALNAIGADPLTYTDPLSARFAGVVSGNPDLQAETADTVTIGFIAEPWFLDGFLLSIDYFNIRIEDAIAAPSSQDIVDNCYDSPTFPNAFCNLFTREDDSGSAQFGGFRFLRQQQVNFGAIESEGMDISARYRFGLFGSDWTLTAQATRTSNMDFFFDPGDPSAVDPELGEIFRPEWAGNFGVTAGFGRLQLGYNLQYIGEQLLRAAEIETYQNIYGAAAEADSMILHDLSGRFDLSDSITLFGGVDNVTDEEPYVTEFSWPSGPRGRFFFLGANTRW